MTTVNFIESIINPVGRFKTLDTIYPTLDAGGSPLFYTTSKTIVFETRLNERRYSLSILTGYSDSEQELIRKNCLAQQIRNISSLAKVRYLPKELLVFDSDNKPCYFDVILQDITDTSELHVYMRKNLFLTDRRPIRNALTAIARLASSLHDNGIIHGAISSRTIRLSETDGSSAFLYDTPLILNKNHEKDTASLIRMAVMLYLAGCQPKLSIMMQGIDLCKPETFSFYEKYILAAAEFHGVRPLENILHALHDNSLENALTEIEILSNTPFESTFPLLEKLLVECCDAEHMEIEPCGTYYESNLKDINTDNSIRVDWDKCSFVGKTSHNLIRFKQGELWGFADKHGNKLPLNNLIDADDFYEGRAVVATTEGYGLIDSQGKYIIKPSFEDMTWWGKENVVTAQIYGSWNMLDRCGNIISKSSFDWMGCFSEGLMLVRRHNKYGFIDKNANTIIPIIYDYASDFDGGKSSVIYKGSEYLIDKNGTRLD